MINSTPLAKFKESTQVLVKGIKTDNKTKIRLLGLGIGVGSSIEILRNRGGDMVLAQNNNRISLGRSIANKILVAEHSGV